MHRVNINRAPRGYARYKPLLIALLIMVIFVGSIAYVDSLILERDASNMNNLITNAGE